MKFVDLLKDLTGKAIREELTILIDISDKEGIIIDKHTAINVVFDSRFMIIPVDDDRVNYVPYESIRNVKTMSVEFVEKAHKMRKDVLSQINEIMGE